MSKECGKVVRDGLVMVDSAYTSQSCSMCGHVEVGNRRTRDEFKCLLCGFEIDADVNASRNIVLRGVEKLWDDGYSSVFGRLGLAQLDGERRCGRQSTSIARQ